jgi:hypothetical protein
MHKAMAWATYMLGLSILTATASASAQVPPNVSIRSAVSGGSGCPGRQPLVGVSADRERIYFANGVLEAHAGPDEPPAEGRKFCQLTIDLDFPSGYSYAISGEWPNRGIVDLDPNVNAELKIERYFTGELEDSEPIAFTFRGPLSNHSFVEPDPDGVMTPFSPCNRDTLLNIKTSVRVSKLHNPSGSGSIRISPPWGIQVLRLHWKRCS